MPCRTPAQLLVGMTLLRLLSVESHYPHDRYKTISSTRLPSTSAAMFSSLSLVLFSTPLLILIFTFIKHQIRYAKSPLKKLPGPPTHSWFYGNLKYIFDRGQSVAWDEWIAKYGKTFQYSSMFNVRFFLPLLLPWPRVDVLQSPFLFTTDPRAVNHILTHSDEFEKPQEAKAVLQLLGEGNYYLSTFERFCVKSPSPQGLIFAEGELHRKQVSPTSFTQTVTLSSSSSPKASYYGILRRSETFAVNY